MITENLILTCARKELNPQITAGALELIKKGPDWRYLADFLISNKIAILAYPHLERLKTCVAIPEEILDKLKNYYASSVRESYLQYKKALQLLKEFQENGIPVIPLKGQLLSTRLYGDFAVRGTSYDIDLLVRQRDVDGATEILKKSGYLRKTNSEDDYLGYSCFFKSYTDIIDLHWMLMTQLDCFPERLDGFWQGTRPAKDSGVGYIDFNEEELLIYLSAHIVGSNCFNQLRYLCDINQLLGKYKEVIRWESVISKAKKWRLSGCLYITLKLSADLFGINLPGGVLKKIKPSLFKVILIRFFCSRSIIFKRRSLRRLLIRNFIEYILLRVIEGRSFGEYFRLFFPPKESMKGGSYLLRFLRSISRILYSLAGKRVKSS